MTKQSHFQVKQKLKFTQEIFIVAGFGNHQNLEISQMPFGWWVGEQHTMTPSYNGKLLSQEKERIFDTCSNVDESHMRLFTERSQTQATSCAPFGRMFCCYCSVAKLCPILCDSRDCSLSGSPVLGISQARVLEWVAISFSGGSSRPRDRTCDSCVSWISRQILYHWVPWEAPWVAIGKAKT